MNRRALLFPLLVVALLLAGAVPGVSSRALQCLVLFALIAAFWSAGRRISSWLVPDFDRLAGAVASVTAAAAFAIGIALVLGTCGLLRPWAYLLTAAVLYIACLALPLRKRPPAPDAPESRTSRVESVLLGSGLAALAIVALGTLQKLRHAAPGANGFDDISYHLSAVAVWHRFGDLRMLKFSFGDPSTAFYPILGEIWSWVLIAPFHNSDFLARWSELPFALLSGLAAASIALRLGVSRRSAALCALLYLSIRHVFPVLALAAGNDQATGFFTLAALDAVLATVRRPTRGSAAYAGLAIGLLAGTKYLALYYSATLFLLLGAGLALRWRERPSEERSWRKARGLGGIVIGVALAALAAGGYTYLRNAWTTGNPFFPAPVSVLGVEVFPGWESTGLAERMRQPDAQIDIWDFLLHQQNLFGQLAPATLVPAALLAPLLALWGPSRKREGRPPFRERIETALVLALPIVFFVQFLFLMHDHRDPRYFLAGIAIAGIAFVWLLEQAGPRIGIPVRCIVLLLTIYHLLRRFRPAIWEEALQIAVLVGAAALVRHFWPRLRAWWARPGMSARVKAAGLGLLAVSAVPLGQVVEKYQVRKLRHEPAVRALEEMAPGGTRVAYLGWNQPYLFSGSRLQNGVDMVPYDWDVSSRFYDWGKDPELPFDHRLPRRWMRLLRTLGIEYVVVIRKGFANPERRWMETRPWSFEKVYDDVLTEIWRIAPPGSGKMRLDDPLLSEPAPDRRRPAGSRPHPDRNRRLHKVAPPGAGETGPAGSAEISGARAPAGARAGEPPRRGHRHRARAGAARRDLAAAPPAAAPRPR